MKKLLKKDWEAIATIYNVFGPAETEVTWKSVQAYSVLSKDIRESVYEAFKKTQSISYTIYLNDLLNSL